VWFVCCKGGEGRGGGVGGGGGGGGGDVRRKTKMSKKNVCRPAGGVEEETDL